MLPTVGSDHVHSTNKLYQRTYCKQTKTSFSTRSRSGCFGLHLSVISVFTNAQTNCTKGGKRTRVQFNRTKQGRCESTLRNQVDTDDKLSLTAASCGSLNSPFWSKCSFVLAFVKHEHSRAVFC